jgi:ParB family chromosome partitioning protein
LENESAAILIPLAAILEPSHRLRETIDAEKLGELADSIAAEGLHQPVGVRGPLTAGVYEIIYGHRRYLACKLLNRATIAAKVYPADFDPLLAAVSENLQREQMTPLEEARAVARFVERGEPDAAIARKFRRSPGWVRSRRELLEMPTDLQEAVQSGQLALGVAAALADIDHPNYRASLIAEAHRTGATTATAELWRQHYLVDRDRIVNNNLVVEEIAARREAWRIVIPCDLCDADKEYQDTRSIRVCIDCARQLAQVKAETKAEALQLATGDEPAIQPRPLG